MGKIKQLKWAGCLLLVVAVGGLLQAGVPVRADTTFPQTGKTVWGVFENYWNDHGGLAQFGLPRTSVYPAGKDYDAQWFERGLFTYNPKHPDPYKVELQLLGSMLTENRRAEAPFKPTQPVTGATFFRETSHNLSGKLLQYWLSTGGLPVYGFPISEQFSEVSKSDGKTYMVQYFERNRLELHPELAGTKFEVQIGLLGSELLDKQGGPAAFAGLGTPRFYTPSAPVNVPGGGIVEPGGSGTPEPTPTAFPNAPALPPVNAPVLYQSDFSSDSSLNDWKPLSLLAPAGTDASGWRVHNGLLEQIGDAHEEGTAEDAFLLLNTNTPLDDFVLDTYFRASSGEPVGVFFRYSSNSFYLLRLYGDGPNNTSKADLLQVGPDKRTPAAPATAWTGYSRNQWHHLRIGAGGSNVGVFVDDQQVYLIQNAALRKGQVGLYAFASGVARFDNLRIVSAGPSYTPTPR